MAEIISFPLPLPALSDRNFNIVVNKRTPSLLAIFPGNQLSRKRKSRRLKTIASQDMSARTHLDGPSIRMG